MKFFLIFFLLLPFILAAQPKFEIREFRGKLLSLETGTRFALERLNVEVNGSFESFLFNPIYGKMLFENLKTGDPVVFKANVNVPLWNSRRPATSRENDLKSLGWLLRRDVITEIELNDKWIDLKEISDAPIGKDTDSNEVFLDKQVTELIKEDGVTKGLRFSDGRMVFVKWLNAGLNPMKDLSVGDMVSYLGFQYKREDGYQYPSENVNSVYYFFRLNKVEVTLESFLFKQNYTCIGVKFKTSDNETLTVSFPSDKAVQIRDFISPDRPLTIYYHSDYIGKSDSKAKKNEGKKTTTDKKQNDQPEVDEKSAAVKISLPELHALIQNGDSLLIKEYGFYGGADIEHDHKDIQLKGRITQITRTPKGNVAALVIDKQYFLEIDAMMAQQLGQFFDKGKEIGIKGMERVKKVGEIYSKNYHIVVPKEITIDGKTFSAYQP